MRDRQQPRQRDREEGRLSLHFPGWWLNLDITRRRRDRPRRRIELFSDYATADHKAGERERKADCDGEDDYERPINRLVKSAERARSHRSDHGRSERMIDEPLSEAWVSDPDEHPSLVIPAPSHEYRLRRTPHACGLRRRPVMPPPYRQEVPRRTPRLCLAARPYWPSTGTTPETRLLSMPKSRQNSARATMVSRSRRLAAWASASTLL